LVQAPRGIARGRVHFSDAKLMGPRHISILMVVCLISKVLLRVVIYLSIAMVARQQPAGLDVILVLVISGFCTEIRHQHKEILCYLQLWSV